MEKADSEKEDEKAAGEGPQGEPDESEKGKRLVFNYLNYNVKNWTGNTALAQAACNLCKSEIKMAF